MTHQTDSPQPERPSARSVADGTRSGPEPVGNVLRGSDRDPALARWRARLAATRAGSLSSGLLIIGDSVSEGTSVTRYRNRWIDRVRRRLQADAPGTTGFLPGSANVFGSVTDAGWAGGDNPWTFTGGVTANIDYGVGFHAISIPPAGTATVTWFGDRITLCYARTSTGPTACSVRLDGVEVGPLDAQGVEAPGQGVTYGARGAYGFHTLTATPNDGILVVEGVIPYDGDGPHLARGGVLVVDATHAGGNATTWAGSNDNWSAALSQLGASLPLVIIALGVNDAGFRTPAEFADDLVTIVERMDARMGGDGTDILFVAMPGVSLEFANAMYDAAARVGSGRASVHDVAAQCAGRVFGSELSDDGTHANDAGHRWLADVVGAVLDPTPPAPQPSPSRQVIEASTRPTSRPAWPEAFAPVPGTTHAYDEAAGGAVRERRHRVWLEPGTYQATLSAEHAAGRGVFEVLLGCWRGNTPTLSSCGAVDTSTPNGPALTMTRLDTTVSTDVAGWTPVVVRKTDTTGIGRFVQLVIERTA
jgi:lysophospholipase L1-like esterase